MASSKWSVAFTASAVVAAGVLFQPSARANGLDQAMQDTFGSMVNSSSPTYAKAADRGVLTGGQMVVKNQISNVQLFNLQMPYIHAGCGGWDAFGGSFSFISSAQIVAMMRSIASNALSYAFSLALEAISPQMHTIMSKIEDAMNMLNNASINSCKTGMAIVDSMTGHSGPQMSDVMGQFFSTDTGAKNDPQQASNAGGATSAGAEAAASNPQAHDAIIPGNSVWAALHSQNVSGWFPGTGGDDRLLQQLMSMTGTVITCVPGQDRGCQSDQPTDPNAQKTPITYDKPYSMTFDDFVEGSSNGRVVQVLTCDTTSSASSSDPSSTAVCLNPTATPTPGFVGMKQVLFNILLVTPCSASEVGAGCGLVGRYALKTKDNSTQDEKMRALLGSPLTQVLNMSLDDENAARINAELLIPKMASDLAYNTVHSALLRALAAEATYHGGDKQTGQLLQNAVERIDHERADYEKALAMTQNQLQYSFYMKALMSNANPAILPHAAAARQ